MRNSFSVHFVLQCSKSELERTKRLKSTDQILIDSLQQFTASTKIKSDSGSTILTLKDTKTELFEKV